MDKFLTKMAKIIFHNFFKFKFCVSPVLDQYFQNKKLYVCFVGK